MKFATFHVVCTFTPDENNRVVLREKKVSKRSMKSESVWQSNGMEGRGELILVDITSSRLHYQP